MPSQSDLRQRMKAIGQTRQITHAMHLLSAAKVRQDAQWVELTRTYFYRVRAAMRDILERSKGIEHRYLEARPGDRVAYIVIAGDKGLAGGYNHNVLKFALEEIRRHECTELIAVGQVAKAFFEARGFPVNADFVGASQRPYLHHARRMIEHIFQLYDEERIDALYAIYTRYESTTDQHPRLIKLLPISLFEYQDVDLEYQYQADILYEPSPQDVFDTLVPEFAVGLLFGLMVQSYVSEHTARMVAMENATQNADDMLADLSLEYNLARQYAITREISEISGAAEALRRPGETV